MSTLETQKHDQHTIDLKILQSDSIICSKSSKEGIVSNCSALQRVGSAFKHIEHLQQLKDEFVEFCVDIYPHSIDDFAHILQCHGDEIKQIQAEFFTHFGLRMCSISECSQFNRHRRREKEEKENEKSGNLEFDFWLEQFDKMHHFIYHLFQTGKRIEFVSTNNDTEFDEEFAQKQKILNDIKQKDKQINIGKEKFLISGGNAKSDKTLLDEMYECIENEQTLQTLKDFIICNDYDSDALSHEVFVALNESNLMKETQSDKLWKSVREFMNLHHVKKKSFSTGIQFTYWADDNYGLRVDSFFTDLKEEILESKFISIDVWKHIVTKAKNHFKSNRAKKTKYCNYYNKHGFNSESLLNLHHLIAIVLYCDYSKLCSFFSATFRKMHPLETEQSVAERNKKFYYFSRYLCEAVTDFGMKRRDEAGPFFCGVNCVLNIGSFAICFHGPTSTTKVIEVAMNFSSDGGSIIELQNDGYGCVQTFFDVSWVSRYPDEDERLWISGNSLRALRIVNFRIIAGCLNFRQYFHALYVFDAMLKRQEIDIKIVKSDYQIMNALINGNDVNIPQFIKDTFLLYRHQKKMIMICPYFLDRHFGKNMVNLIMCPLKNYAKKNEKENHLYNVPKPILFDLFPNLDEIRLHTTSGGGYVKNEYPEYKVLLRSFLSFISYVHAKLSIKYSIIAYRQYDHKKDEYFGKTWLENIDLSWINENNYNVEKAKKYTNVFNNQHMQDALNIKKLVPIMEF